MHAPIIFRDLVVLFGLAVVAVLLLQRLRLPPIVGFLLTGVLSGPYGFGLISGVGQVDALAEVGVVLLLFTIGLELSPRELVRLRSVLLAGGGLQVGLTMAAAAGVVLAVGLSWPVATLLGMMVALSSTAIVLRLLTETGQMDAPHGRTTLGILIFQDLVVVAMLLLVPILAGTGEGLEPVLAMAARALLFAAAALVVARWVVPWLLDIAARTRRREVFLLAIILLCFGAAWASAQAGLSLALGAFLAGLAISDTTYNHQAMGEILPLREVFNALFFVSIGMLFDVRTVLEEPLLVGAAVVGVIVAKALITGGVTIALGHSLRVAAITGLALAQIGEFSFVVARAGMRLELLDDALYQLFLAVAVGTMALTPALLAVGPRVAALLEPLAPAGIVRGRTTPPAIGEDGEPLHDHVIIVGYGLNGRNLARVLARVNIPFVVIEMNPESVRVERKRGRRIIFGDATRREVLEHAGIGSARVLVVAISDPAATRAAVDLARRLNDRVHIIVRTRYVQEMEGLLGLGTQEVIPEEFETSVEIFSRVLHRYLVPRDVIDRLTREIRSGGYEMFRTMSVRQGPALGLQRFLTDLAFEVYRVEEGSPLAGQTLQSSHLREQGGVTVVAIHRPDGSIVPNPAGRERLESDDLVLLIGRHEQITRAAPLFRSG